MSKYEKTKMSNFGAKKIEIAEKYGLPLPLPRLHTLPQPPSSKVEPENRVNPNPRVNPET